ncbi:MAG: NAD(P)-dependent oxidoreductase [Acidobacteriota bacterium]
MHQPTIGFIGLGIMGRPMALNLAKAGHRLTVYNRTRSRAEAIASDWIQVADSPRDVASACELIFVMVTDSAAVESVVAGPRGIVETIRPGSLVVDMSTISPAVEQSLDRRLQAAGAGLMDAPVSGGDVGAQQGTLAIMVGGCRPDYERILPILQAMGRTITWCGPVGSGQLTKLCNQILVSLNLLAVSEALAFAKKNGLDPAVMIEAVRGGAAGSWQLSNLGPRIVAGDFQPGFMVDLMQKDLRLVMEAAGLAQSPLPGTALVHQLFTSAQARGLGREGTQALAKVLAQLS